MPPIAINPSKYSYHDDPYLRRSICLDNASSCLVLFTLTGASPKPQTYISLKQKKYSAGNCVWLRIPVQESEDALALLKNHWCIYILYDYDMNFFVLNFPGSRIRRS